MIEDPVAEWRELSALYEQADQLSGAALRDWIAGLPDDARQLVPRLERMLAARDRAAAEQFLEALPPLSDAADHEPLGWEAGRRIGPYRLVRHAGSGGMAEVWLAERDDGAFSRRVAIKLLRNHPTRAERDNFVERFKRERDILASLDHPNIAGLLDAGVAADGQPWLALEFVEGEPITAWCDRERLTIEDRVRLFRQVLLAIEHAHARLVIHRDVKPSNVLVTASGAVSLLDFGIAKLLESDGQSHVATALTQQGGRPLTPQYASPEQLLGEPLTTACDVYSLGVMLYQLLVGRLPYELKGRSLAELETAVTGVDPTPPSRRTVTVEALARRQVTWKAWRRTLKPDLDAIVMRALEKAPDRRYESVGALRSELDRWLADEPVLATVPGPAYRLAKFLRRHARGVAIAASVVCIVVALLAVTAWQAAVSDRQTALARDSSAFVLDALRDSNPESSKDAGAAAGPLLDQSLARADRLLANQPELHAEVLERIAEVDQNLDRYLSAQSVLEHALAIRRALGHDEKTALVAIKLAVNSRRIGDNTKATNILATLPHSSGAEVHARAKALEGWLAWDRDDTFRARTAWLDALSTAKGVVAHNDLTASVLQGLVNLEMTSGDYAAAERYADEEVSVSEGMSATTMTDRIAALSDRAEVTFASGDYIRSLPMTRTTLDDCIKTLGTHAEACFVMRRQLALILLRIYANTESLELLPALDDEAKNILSPVRRIEAESIVLRIRSANGLLGDKERSLLSDLKPSLPLGVRLTGYLALAEADVRRHDAVAALHDLDLLAAQAETVPQNFAIRALMIRGLADHEQGRTSDALRTLAEAEKGYAAMYGANHTQTVLCELNAVAPLLASGNGDQARRRVVRAVALLKDKLPSEAPLFAILSSLDKRRANDPDSSPKPVPFFN